MKATIALLVGLGLIACDRTSERRDLETGEIRRLTQHSAADVSPSWSPDGQHIAFVSDRDVNHEIYVMDSDGSNLRRLTQHSARALRLSWSPDGQHIAFDSHHDGNREIYVMGSDGSNPRRLTQHSADDLFPSWSPDGRHIAFQSDRDDEYGEIYVMDSDGSNLHRLTQHSANDLYPSWSPDGRHIAFQSHRDGNPEIYVMGSDGSNLHRLTHHRGEDLSPPSWSPDGRHIVFDSHRDGNPEIYVIELREDDHGDSHAAATRISLGSATSGVLAADDSDYFCVSVNGSATLTAHTTGSMDTYGTLYNSEGISLANDDDSGGDTNFAVSAAVSAGTYYIEVHGSTSSTGSYVLRVETKQQGQ